MKTQTVMATVTALAAAVLLSGVTAASAASAMKPRAQDTLDLTSAQQKTAWSDLDHASNQAAPSGFAANAGAKVPATVRISAVPSKASRDVSQLRVYDFAKVGGKILIVNPSDRKVAEVIAG